jgi:16S rRNA (guanine1207-N2)-methyltransferase
VIHAEVLGHAVRFETRPGLFSPASLDAGTLAMLGLARFDEDDKVLDLGCGYGLVGVTVALEIGPNRVWMLDVDPTAVACARRNLVLNGVAGAKVVESDGFRGLSEIGFTKILCNPPYHADFSVAKHVIEKGFNRLVVGGALWMVTKREAWYRNKLTAIFGGVRVHAADGYVVFEAVKKSANYAGKRG